MRNFLWIVETVPKILILLCLCQILKCFLRINFFFRYNILQHGYYPPARTYQHFRWPDWSLQFYSGIFQLTQFRTFRWNAKPSELSCNCYYSQNFVHVVFAGWRRRIVLGQEDGRNLKSWGCTPGKISNLKKFGK